MTMLRGALVSLIYAQALKLQAGVYDESAALTLMSTDIDRITTTLPMTLQMWSQVIQVALGIWLLEIQLGWVCVAPIVVVLSKLLSLSIGSTATDLSKLASTVSFKLPKSLAQPKRCF